MFGVIDVVYKPLQHILRIPVDAINAAMTGMNITNNYMAQNAMISRVQADPTAALQWFSAEQVEKIQTFNFHFLGIDLSQMPQLNFSPEFLPLLVFPCIVGFDYVPFQHCHYQNEWTGNAGQHEMDALDYELDVCHLQLPSSCCFLSVLHHL